MMSTTRESPTRPERRFFGQPWALVHVFGVEMWERFSFYGMQGILLIYLYSPSPRAGSVSPRPSPAGSWAPTAARCTSRRSSDTWALTAASTARAFTSSANSCARSPADPTAGCGASSGPRRSRLRSRRASRRSPRSSIRARTASSPTRVDEGVDGERVACRGGEHRQVGERQRRCAQRAPDPGGELVERRPVHDLERVQIARLEPCRDLDEERHGAKAADRHGHVVVAGEDGLSAVQISDVHAHLRAGDRQRLERAHRRVEGAPADRGTAREAAPRALRAAERRRRRRTIGRFRDPGRAHRRSFHGVQGRRGYPQAGPHDTVRLPSVETPGLS